MSIESKLQGYFQTSVFQSRCQSHYKAAIASGKSFGSRKGGASGIGANDAEARKYVDEILEFIRQTIVAKFPNMPADLFRVYGPFQTNSGFYEYRIFFEPAAVHRESLYHEGYPDGLENIIALYSHGSSPAKNPVWNRAAFEWDYNRKRQYGEYRMGRHIFIQNGWWIDPEPFLTSAIAVLNNMYASKNIKVKLDPKYYP